MKYYCLAPEVGGGFGEHTLMDSSVRPPRLTRFHYKFDGWLGDDLLETVACFIGTRRLVDRLQSLNPTGLELDRVEISKSDEFKELHPDRALPEFAWLKITGEAGRDDFGLSQEHRLVVSERVLSVLNSLTLNNCEVWDYDAPMTVP
jgi:hypothetical protein